MCFNLESDVTINLCTNLAPFSLELTFSALAIVPQATPLLMVVITVVAATSVIAVMTAVVRDAAQEQVAE